MSNGTPTEGQVITVDKKFNRFSRTLFSEMTQKPGQYWKGAWKFWHQVKGEGVDKLTPGQYDWLAKIENDLIDIAKENQ